MTKLCGRYIEKLTFPSHNRERTYQADVKCRYTTSWRCSSRQISVYGTAAERVSSTQACCSRGVRRQVGEDAAFECSSFFSRLIYIVGLLTFRLLRNNRKEPSPRGQAHFFFFKCASNFIFLFLNLSFIYLIQRQEVFCFKIRTGPNQAIDCQGHTHFY